MLSPLASIARSPNPIAQTYVERLLLPAVVLVIATLVVMLIVRLLRSSEGTGDEAPEAASPKSKASAHLRRLSRLLRSVRSINSAIVTERDASRLLQRACEILTSTRGYRMVWIGLREEEGARVVPVGRAGAETDYLDEVEITYDESPTGRGPTGRAVRTGEPSVIRDIESAVGYDPWREEALERGYRSSVALPLRSRGETLGALNVYSGEPNAFDIEEVGLLQELSDHLAFAVAGIRLEETLAEVKARLSRMEPVGAAFEGAEAGLLVTDADGLVTRANARVVRLLDGAESAGEVRGRDVRDFAPFGGKEARQALDRLADEAQSVEFEASSLCCHGVAIRRNGEPAGALWLVERR